jgi:hypothetical protein
MSGSRDHLRVVAAADGAAVPPLALARLRWRLATHRLSAIKGVETCIARVAALRQRLDDPALDTVLDRFRSIRAELRAMDPDGPIDDADLKALVDRLMALQSDVARFGALTCGASEREQPVCVAVPAHH